MQKQSFSQGFRKLPQNQKTKYHLKRSCTLLEPFRNKSKFSQLCLNYRGLHLWNTIVIRQNIDLGQNIDLEQSTAQKICKEKIKIYLFSLYGVSF